MIAQSLFASERDDWNSPEEVLRLVRSFSRIALDPCSNEASIVGATEEWRLTDGRNGLLTPWHSDGGVCWVNPPYGRELYPWCGKMAAEGKRGVQIIGLVPARTDTAWFQDHLTKADALCFWRGRLKFGDAIADKLQVVMFDNRAEVERGQVPRDAAPFPSVLPYWGANAYKFKRAFEDAGWVVLP